MASARREESMLHCYTPWKVCWTLRIIPLLWKICFGCPNIRGVTPHWSSEIRNPWNSEAQMAESRPRSQIPHGYRVRRVRSRPKELPAAALLIFSGSQPQSRRSLWPALRSTPNDQLEGWLLRSWKVCDHMPLHDKHAEICRNYDNQTIAIHRKHAQCDKCPPNESPPHCATSLSLGVQRLIEVEAPSIDLEMVKPERHNSPHLR